MNKLRLSYTLLAYWERGDIKGAIDSYLHKATFTSDAMQHGKDIHKELADYIREHKKFPEWFFTMELKDPEPEREVVVSYNDMFDLKGIFDCLDRPNKTLFEFKTGKSDSLEWAKTWQLPMYFLIAELANIDIDKAVIIRHDGKESDYCVVHNSKRNRDLARNIIERYGPEIYNNFMNEGIL